MIFNTSTVNFALMPTEKLTHLIFTLLIFDALQDVVDNATPGGVVKESVFVVDNETAVKQTSYRQCVWMWPIQWSSTRP